MLTGLVICGIIKAYATRDDLQHLQLREHAEQGRHSSWEVLAEEQS